MDDTFSHVKWRRGGEKESRRWERKICEGMRKKRRERERDIEKMFKIHIFMFVCFFFLNTIVGQKHQSFLTTNILKLVFSKWIPIRIILLVYSASF